jgi:hypothetical protein
MSVFSPFIWDGDWYNSAAAAFHASKLESRTARIPFIKYNCKSWQANQIGSQICEWDMRPNWHAGSPSRSRAVSLPHIKTCQRIKLLSGAAL